MKPRILHIACENYAGVPYSLVRAERMLGYNSDIIVLLRSGSGHPCENVLGLPLAKGVFPELLRHITGSTQIFENTRYKGQERPPLWKPKWGKFLFSIRDHIWKGILRRHGIPDMLKNYDIIVLDGGVGFLRSSEFIANWAREKGRLAVIFYGDDLRRRGAIPEIEKLAKLFFTFEFDHTLIHPKVRFLFYPFFADEMPERRISDDGILRIGHSPTKRASKGTDAIIKVLQEISRVHKNVRAVLIEGLPYPQALHKKSELDIFIDQIGELGYGISGLEALAMGIPTVVELMPDFEKFLGPTPFVNVNEKNLYEKLDALIKDANMRDELGNWGAEWVRDVHNPQKAAEAVEEEYKRIGWL